MCNVLDGFYVSDVNDGINDYDFSDIREIVLVANKSPTAFIFSTVLRFFYSGSVLIRIHNLGTRHKTPKDQYKKRF
jgi:hypothetical protein